MSESDPDKGGQSGSLKWLSDELIISPINLHVVGMSYSSSTACSLCLSSFSH